MNRRNFIKKSILAAVISAGGLIGFNKIDKKTWKKVDPRNLKINDIAYIQYRHTKENKDFNAIKIQSIEHARFRNNTEYKFGGKFMNRNCYSYFYYYDYDDIYDMGFDYYKLC